MALALLVLGSAIWIFNLHSERRPVVTNSPEEKTATISALSGIWEGAIRFGKNGDTPFMLKITPDGSSVVQSSAVTGEVLHRATLSKNALAWRSGRMQGLAWTLTPNADAETAVLTLTYANGLTATATFKRTTSVVSPANGKVTAAESSP